MKVFRYELGLKKTGLGTCLAQKSLNTGLEFLKSKKIATDIGQAAAQKKKSPSNKSSIFKQFLLKNYNLIFYDS